MNLLLVTVLEFIRQYLAEAIVVIYKVFLFSSTVNRIWSTDSEEVIFHTGCSISWFCYIESVSFLRSEKHFGKLKTSLNISLKI